MDKLLKYSDQQFRKRTIYSCIRDFGVEEVTEMLGLGDDQVSLTYKYSNCDATPVPNDRWKKLEWALSRKPDKRHVRDKVDPSVIISLHVAGQENGRVDDEIDNIHIYTGKILEILKSAENSQSIDVVAIQGYAEKIANETATIKKELS